MPTDQQAIQGLWRVVSCISQGRPTITGTTHYQFDGNRVKEIDPSQVDGGDWATFELDPKDEPKRFTMMSELRFGKRVRRVDCWLYDLEGDTLRLCWPNVFGDYPDEISEKNHGVITLARDPGPPPQTKRPSGKKPIKDPLLGQAIWNDNFDWWETQVELKPGVAISLHVEPGDERDDASAVAIARDFLVWLRQNEQTARQFAAAKLLDTHNEGWNEGKLISAQTFAQRMTLESVGVDSEGKVELYYNDGDLFWGHSIVVSLAENREFKDAYTVG